MYRLYTLSLIYSRIVTFFCSSVDKYIELKDTVTTKAKRFSIFDHDYKVFCYQQLMQTFTDKSVVNFTPLRKFKIKFICNHLIFNNTIVCNL